MTLLAIIILVLAVGSYSISQLIMHGKLRWSRRDTNFWDIRFWNRKYKWDSEGSLIKAPDNFYYKHIARVKYRERWFTSTWLTVAFTDGYHASQSISFLCLAGSLSLFSGYSFWWFWPTLPFVHAVWYRIFSK